MAKRNVMLTTVH